MRVISEISVKEGIDVAVNTLKQGVDGVFLTDAVNDKNQLGEAHAALFSNLVKVCDKLDATGAFSGRGWVDDDNEDEVDDDYDDIELRTAKYVGLKLLNATSAVAAFDRVADDWGHGILSKLPAAIWTDLTPEPLEQVSELRNKNPWLLNLKHHSGIAKDGDARFIDAIPVEWLDDREKSMHRIRRIDRIRREIGDKTIVAVHGSLSSKDIGEIAVFADEVIIPYEEDSTNLEEIILAARKINED